MRLLSGRAALVTVCALFAALALAAPSSPARAAPLPGDRTAEPATPAGPAGIHAAVLAGLAAARHAAQAQAATLIVRRGDTLSEIARRACHRASFWPEVWWRNRHRVHNPNLIVPGQRLRVPNCRPTRRRVVTAALAAVPVHQPAPPPPAGAAPLPTPVPAPAPESYSGGGGMQSCIIAAESGGNAQVMNATGHYGLYQFSASTWAAHGGNPADFGHASVAEQNQVYANTVAADGYSDWAPYDGC